MTPRLHCLPLSTRTFFFPELIAWFIVSSIRFLGSPFSILLMQTISYSGMTLFFFSKLIVAFDIFSILFCGRKAITTVGLSLFVKNSGFLKISSAFFINTSLSGYSSSGIPLLFFFPKIVYHIFKISSSFWNSSMYSTLFCLRRNRLLRE